MVTQSEREEIAEWCADKILRHIVLLNRVMPGKLCVF
jgi:hypothetical protein